MPSRTAEGTCPHTLKISVLRGSRRLPPVCNLSTLTRVTGLKRHSKAFALPCRRPPYRALSSRWRGMRPLMLARMPLCLLLAAAFVNGAFAESSEANSEGKARLTRLSLESSVTPRSQRSPKNR